MTHSHTDTEAFTRAYRALNEAQKRTVDTTEGPVMVVAGPGTGKTQILTLRIARILAETDIGPENILALTFTESGATAMRERLRGYIGPAAYRVAIHTFHGFAESLIRAYPDAFERIIGGRAVRDVEQVELIEDILKNDSYTHIRPVGNPSFYVPHIIRTIKTLKQEYVAPDDLAAIIKTQEKELAGTEREHTKGPHRGKVRGEYQKKEKVIAKNRELLAVYRSYEAYCRDAGLYDYEDMVVETVHALRADEEMRLDLQETYQYILADEHQDVNASQNAMLELLASYHESPNLFVVGDEKQAIYRFQGASLENFLYFEDAFTNAQTIALTDNYRSGQSILDLAHDLISTNAGAAEDLRVPLTAAGAGGEGEIATRSFSHRAVEDEWVVDDITGRIRAGVPQQEIAVIVRTNREVEEFTTLLREKSVPVLPSADSDILTHPITRTVRELMCAVEKPESEEMLFALLHGAYWGIDPEDLVRICSHRSYSRPLARLISSREELTLIGVTNPDAVLRIPDVLTRARERAAYESPHRVLEYLLAESGLLDRLLTAEPLEAGRVIRRLYDEIEEMVRSGAARSLGDVVSAFERRVAYGLPLSAPFIGNQDDAVQVMTAHKSKGLEFSCVYVPHLTDAAWGGRRRPEYFKIPLLKHLTRTDFDELDDERRLLYVAMTRAKEVLSLSYAKTNAEGRAFVPSRLLEEIDEERLSFVSTEVQEDAFAPTAHLGHSAASPRIEAGLLRHLFLTRGLSVTALNNYLRSPWEYLYRNMLRVPEVQPLSMLYGSAMHAVMEEIARVHAHSGVLPEMAAIEPLLSREIGRLPVSTEEYTQLHEKGLTALVAYREYLKRDIGAQSRQEFALRVTLETGDADLPEIPLTGVIDRIDLSESGKAVQFVDYKTGKPQSKNVIEGKTKTSTGDYKRQLVFYALLLSLYDDDRYRCRTGALSFLEPDARGRIRHEVFTITDEEITELRAEIIRVAKEIVSGTFLTEPCDSEVSSYCHYAAALHTPVGRPTSDTSK